jgi:DNA-binding Xre family transcriptional regulator
VTPTFNGRGINIMTCVLTLDNVMTTQDDPQFRLRLIAYFEWNKWMGIALKNARNKQNISLRNLAKKIEEQTGVKISNTYISDLESGKADSVKKDKLLALTSVLGITVDDLYPE